VVGGAELACGAVSGSDCICAAGIEDAFEAGVDGGAAAGGSSGSAQSARVRAAAARANCMPRSASSVHMRRRRAVRSSASFGWLGAMAFRVLVLLVVRHNNYTVVLLDLASIFVLVIVRNVRHLTIGGRAGVVAAMAACAQGQGTGGGGQAVPPLPRRRVHLRPYGPAGAVHRGRDSGQTRTRSGNTSRVGD
jgi:hypothetical protein